MIRITQRLRAGDRLLLDGGTGSELQRRGVDVLLGSTGRLKAWSATANLAAGDVVRQVHQDYLRVGADIITSNNFWTSPSRLATLDARDDWRTYAEAAARNALAAREAGNKQAYVAGGIAPPALQDRDSGDLASDVARLGESAFAREIGDHARLLAAASVDLILLEHLGYIEECVAAVQACSQIELPLFVGIRHIGADGSMQYGESLADLAAELQGLTRSPDAILLMCSNPEAVDAGLPILREAADGPVGCYPNLGYNPTGPVANRPVLTNQRPSVSPDILQGADYPPARLAEFARRWMTPAHRSSAAAARRDPSTSWRCARSSTMQPRAEAEAAAIRIATIDDVREAERGIRRHVSAAPLIRSHALERELGMPAARRVWLKDYGWTPVGSFKLLGALHWMASNLARIGDRPVVAHSSGNFASGIAFAGMRLGKRVLIVMPDTAARTKVELTRSFGAEIRTYDIARDHETGERDRLTREIADQEGAIQASPYDDADVIAGNGVGGLEIVHELQAEGRAASHLFCQVSGGGLMAGHALAIADGFPHARIVGVEPEGAADFRASLDAGQRVRVERPTSICDGLLSYDVGEHNWPILQRHVAEAVAVPDRETREAMRWLYDRHGLRTEPSGAIAAAALLSGRVSLDGEGDLVVILSGRNVDEDQFRGWITPV